MRDVGLAVEIGPPGSLYRVSWWSGKSWEGTGVQRRSRLPGADDWLFFIARPRYP